uniref:Integrase catalytic domain-containing protein n=1 Tax=Tanacetum cinerariifolium TaxID=118510 RepID=A0A699HBP4_TANCI|nr:hypothetical protein [Tanacetum cinerariifolium]
MKDMLLLEETPNEGKSQENVPIKLVYMGFFLATKDETSGILKSFIIRIENLVDHNVKVIRYDNGTEFKNREMNQFCEMKGILRQFSVARTPQQNEVAERRSRTLIEAARTMLADSKTPTLCFMRPFGCPILNTIDHLGKFDGKDDEGFFVGYSLNSKSFRVFNSITRIVDENLHIRFSESTPNVVGTQSNSFASTKQVIMHVKLERRHNLSKITFCYHYGLLIHHFPKIQRVLMMMDPNLHVMMERRLMKIQESECKYQEKEYNVNSTNNVNTAGNVNIVSLTVNVAGINEDNELPFDPNMPALEDVSIFNFSSDDKDDGTVADMNNLDTTIQVSPIPTTRIHKDHTLDQVIRYLQSATQTRKMSKNLEEHGFC